MATRTTNWNLYKPEATDNFSDFRDEFNDNMDIIDENLGGGGGGGGDVMDVEVNGVSVLDPDDKIAKITSYKEVTESEYESIPIAERETNGIAYFIKDLNNASVQGYPPLIYSDEEREVGVWRDGKPLYQKTWEFSSAITIQSNTWTDTTISNSDIESIAQVVGHNLYADKISCFNGLFASADTGSYIRVMQTRNNSIPLKYLTLWYTKLSDTPGSGIWNGQGGIAHHYSTNETVIGTWFGKPLYEKTIEQNNIMMGVNGGTSTTLAHNISNLKECVDLQMCCPKLGYYTKDILSSSTGNVFAHFSVNSTNIYCTGGSNYFGATADRYWYFKIQYTKTTD